MTLHAGTESTDTGTYNSNTGTESTGIRTDSTDTGSDNSDNKPAVPAAGIVAVKAALTLIVRCLNSYLGTNLEVSERAD